MTPPQLQPQHPYALQEYIITEHELFLYESNGFWDRSERRDISALIRSRPHTQTPETCKKYWNYRADSGHLYHLLYDLLGVMPTPETLGDALMQVRDRDTAISNATLDELVYWLYDVPFRGQDDAGKCHRTLALKLESLRPPTQEQL